MGVKMSLTSPLSPLSLPGPSGGAFSWRRFWIWIRDRALERE